VDRDLFRGSFDSRVMPHILSCFVSSVLGLHSDVDYFIEQLEKTIQFFSGLQNPSGGGERSDDNEFVPFI
jgi:hypothetical protein